MAETPLSLQFIPAVTEAEIRACHPVVVQLRPHLDERAFLAQVQRQRMQGYQVVAGIDDTGQVVVVAGYVLREKLAWGRHLYVDDLVTAADRRASDAGAAMLDWLQARALEAGCVSLHLDSSVQRSDAHRFYDRAGLERSALHFSMDLSSAEAGAEASPVPERVGGVDRQDHLQQMLARRFPGSVSDKEGAEGEEADDDDFLDPSHEGGLDRDFEP